MGYVLFTSSGTFKPADYGLAPGDTIQIVAIGGGAGGAGIQSPGSAGSASSFGNILTAPGGTACVDASTSGALSEGMLPGTNTAITYVLPNDNDKEYGVGGQGGPGWMPGEAREYFELFCQLIYSSSGNITYGAILWQKAAPSFMQQAASVVPFGASGAYAAYNRRNYNFKGVGGRGYGAGGGGVMGNTGGNSGALRHASYKLPSTAAIAVTVGNGGAGGYYQNTNNYAGGGARGCVAVFW